LLTTARTLISTDTLVESIHFDTSFHPPYLLGRKSIAVNLSDIAAMGGKPRFVLLSLCLPEDLEWEWIKEWLDGALAILQESDCILVGGDTVKAKSLVFSITVLGEPVAAHGAVYRGGACVGDSVWVSGNLGSAGAGLGLLNYRKDHPDFSVPVSMQDLLDAHLNPFPCIELGQELAKSGLVTAMQDISDGLATDLAHLCKASGFAAKIQADRLPRHAVLTEAAGFLGKDVNDLLLCAGEDYQLVFTVKKGEVQAFIDRMEQNKQNITQIGTIIEGAGVFLEENEKITEISFQGYEH
jgi:thiamine-monophosphate kinase